MRKIWKHLVVFSLLATTLLSVDTAEARRRRRGRKLPIINEKKLYERIGGLTTLRGLTDEWVRKALADARLNSELDGLKSEPAALGRFRTWLYEQSCELADGPCEPKDLTGTERAAWRKFDSHHFLIFADHLAAGFDQLRLVERDKNDLLARWGHFDRRPEISNGPANPPATLPGAPPSKAIPQMGPDPKVEKPGETVPLSKPTEAPADKPASTPLDISSPSNAQGA